MCVRVARRCGSIDLSAHLCQPLSLLILLLYVSFGHLNGEENILCVPPFWPLPLPLCASVLCNGWTPVALA